MFRKMFKQREPSGGKAPVMEEDSKEKEGTEEGVLAEPVQAEGALSSEPEVVPTTEESKQGMAPESAEGEAAGEQKDEEGNSSLASLFAQTGQEEESSLGALLDLVSDTTVQELLGDVAEIKAILRGRLPE